METYRTKINGISLENLPNHTQAICEQSQYLFQAHSALAKARRQIVGFLQGQITEKIGMPEPERRRSRVLSWILLTLILMLLMTLIVEWMGVPNGEIRSGIYRLLFAGLLIPLVSALVSNTLGKYTLAVGITVACAILGPWLSVAVDPTILRGDFVPLTYIALSVLLSSILLSVRATMVLSALQMTALLILAHFIHTQSPVNWASLLLLILFMSVLGVVSNKLSRQDMEIIERQAIQLRESEAMLRELSIRDPLTGLYNRRFMEESLEREMSRAARNQTPLSVIMVDIDYFKQFNDCHGHPEGDVLLHRISQALRTNIRKADIVCRYGGEEFILILPETPMEKALECAERLRQIVAREQAEGNANTGTVTLSFGVATFPKNGQTSDELVRAADQALYRAKHEGRNRIISAA